MSIENLVDGLFIASKVKENDEQLSNRALGIRSHESRHAERKWQYAKQVKRILRDMRLVVSLAKNVDILSSEMGGFLPEEIISYHRGAFLTLCHQLKDKLIKLIYITDPEYKDFKNTRPKIKLSRLLNMNIDKDVKDIVKKYDDEAEIDRSRPYGISLALKKRTKHHHYISPLDYDEDLSKIQFARTMLKPEAYACLSEFGKTRAAEILKKGLDNLQTKGLAQMGSVLAEVECDVDQISQKLVCNYGLKTTVEENQKIFERSFALDKSLEIKNVPRAPNVECEQKDQINCILANVSKLFGESNLKATYVVAGESCNSQMFIVVSVSTEGIVVPKDDMQNNIDVILIDEETFRKESSMKIRFICAVDGFLFQGCDLIENEVFPLIGLRLAWLLNKDKLLEMDEIQKWLDDNKGPTVKDMTIIGRKISNIIIDTIYGMAMTNDPKYCRLRKDKIEHIVNVFPENVVGTRMIQYFSQKDIVDLGELKNFYEIGRFTVDRHYENMANAIKEFDDQQPGSIQ